MKKRWISILSVFLIVVISGCSSQATSAIETIKKEGVLNVGVKENIPNFSNKNPETGEIEGFEVDLAQRIANEIIGENAKLELKVETAANLGLLLDSNEVNLITATFSITDERKENYNFSQPYYSSGTGLLVKKASGYKNLKNLEGKTIGVVENTPTMEAVKAAAAAQGVTLELMTFLGHSEAKAALDSETIQCFAGNTGILKGYLDNSTVILDDRFAEQDYGVATKKEDKDLADQVNKIISKLKTNGELDAMIAKWQLN